MRVTNRSTIHDARDVHTPPPTARTPSTVSTLRVTSIDRRFYRRRDAKTRARAPPNRLENCSPRARDVSDRPRRGRGSGVRPCRSFGRPFRDPGRPSRKTWREPRRRRHPQVRLPRSSAPIANPGFGSGHERGRFRRSRVISQPRRPSREGRSSDGAAFFVFSPGSHLAHPLPQAGGEEEDPSPM